MEKNSSSIKLFDCEGALVRTVLIDGDVWFVAKDVCDILGLVDVTTALRSLDEDEKSLREISGASKSRQMNVISEAGIYKLIFRSNKPEAKKFLRWVTHELLPKVMRTGRYTASIAGKNPLELDAEGICRIMAALSILRSRENYWEAILDGLEKFCELLPDEQAKNEAQASYDVEELRTLDALANVAQRVIKTKLRVLREKIQLLDSISLVQL